MIAVARLNWPASVRVTVYLFDLPQFLVGLNMFPQQSRPVLEGLNRRVELSTRRENFISLS